MYRTNFFSQLHAGSGKDIKTLESLRVNRQNQNKPLFTGQQVHFIQVNKQIYLFLETVYSKHPVQWK